MTTTSGRKIIGALLAGAFLAACGDEGSPVTRHVEIQGSLFALELDQQWGLPEELQEISGLAVSPDGRLFAHDDEQAVIYEIDFDGGRYTKSFSLGNPARKGDFEGLAISADGTFWLTDSRGELFSFREGENGAHVEFERIETGLDNICEVEGLAYLAAEESLILACKRNEARDMRENVDLYRWPFSGDAELWRRMSEPELANAAGVGHFRPSSIEFDSRTGRIILISANDAALVELDGEGALLSARELEGPHPQPEGVTVMPDGALVIADEGGDGQGRLSRYPRIP
jgi:uncharacterized protein YjiK